MQLILNIPAQKATQNEARLASLFLCYKDGTLLLDSRDNKKPPRFLLTKEDFFPWEDFIQKLLVAWEISDYSQVPLQFKPIKRVPQYVLDGILKEPLSNKLKVFALLRKQGFLPQLVERK